MSVLQYHVKDMIGCYNSEAFGLEENKIDMACLYGCSLLDLEHEDMHGYL